MSRGQQYDQGKSYTVAEYIKLLKKMPQDMEVYTLAQGGCEGEPWPAGEPRITPILHWNYHQDCWSWRVLDEKYDKDKTPTKKVILVY